jgi:hypothetical protein
LCYCLFKLYRVNGSGTEKLEAKPCEEKRFEAQTCLILFVFFHVKKRKLSKTDHISLRDTCSRRCRSQEVWESWFIFNLQKNKQSNREKIDGRIIVIITSEMIWHGLILCSQFTTSQFSFFSYELHYCILCTVHT